MSNRSKYEQGLQKLKADAYLANLEMKEGFQLWHGKETYAWNDEVIVNVFAVPLPKAYGDDWGSTDLPQDWEGYGEEDVAIEEPYFDENLQEENLEPGEPMPQDLEVWDTQPYLEEQGPDLKDTSSARWAELVMNRKFLQPISRNERYMEATAQASDVHFWMDYDLIFSEAMKGAGQYRTGMGPDVDSYMKAMMAFFEIFYADTYFSLGLNFENGKMAMSNQLFFNDDMQRFYQQVFKVKFNKKFLRYVKGGDQLFGYLYMNYNVENTIQEGKSLMYKVLDATPQYGDLARDAMQILGIFIDEDAIGKLMKGDLLLSVSGMQSLEMKQKIYDYDADFNLIEKDTVMLKTIPVFTALASYGNEKDIMKFVNLGMHAGALKKEGRYYRATLPEMGGMDLFLALQNGVLVQNLEKGLDKKLRLSKKHRKLLCKNATAFYWDIPNTIRAAAGDQADTNVGEMAYLNMMGKQFESLEMAYSKKIGNSLKGHIDFNFVKKDANALQLFFNFINDLFLEMEGGAKI
jgi:hypothetical protein